MARRATALLAFLLGACRLSSTVGLLGDEKNDESYDFTESVETWYPPAPVAPVEGTPPEVETRARRPIPSCAASGGERPCWSIEPAPFCLPVQHPHTADKARLHLRVVRPAPTPAPSPQAHTTTRARCATVGAGAYGG